MERNNVAHRVEGSTAKVCQQGLFICDTDGKLGRQEVIYWFGKHYISKVDVADRKYGPRNWVGRSREGCKSQGADCGAGVVAVGLGT